MNGIGVEICVVLINCDWSVVMSSFYSFVDDGILITSVCSRAMMLIIILFSINFFSLVVCLNELNKNFKTKVNFAITLCYWEESKTTTTFNSITFLLSSD